MDDITSMLNQWVNSVKTQPQSNTIVLMTRLAEIQVSPQLVQSKDMPPIG